MVTQGDRAPGGRRFEERRVVRLVVVRQIEKFLGFINDIDSNGILTITVQEWENCEYVPAVVSREYACASYFPFPVKFIKIPRDRFFSRTYLAVRTDIYPLLWIYIWLQLQVENLIYVGWCKFMWGCNWCGVAKTPLGCDYNFKDFKYKYATLDFLNSLAAIGTAISWFVSDHPYIGFLWLLLWSWIQLRMWQDRRNREKLIADLELYLQSVQQNWTEDTAFVRDLAGNLIPAFSSQTLAKSDCQNCKYFYGEYNIVCAVHPEGYETDSCPDLNQQ